MINIVISYRRSDTEVITGRIFDSLVQHYGLEAVFMDVEKLRFGPDYRTGVEEAISKADIMIVIVGPNWLAKDDHGASRLMQDGDPVRSELEAAYRHNIPILPVTINPAVMPKERDLPASLSHFAYNNGGPIDPGRGFRANITSIIGAIDEQVGKSKGPPDERGPPPEPEDEASDQSEADEDAIFFPPGSRHSLAERIESIARRRGPVELSTITIIAGFILSFLSQSFGLGWLTYDVDGVSKQVSFLFAPNWTIVYVILFPPYVAVFSLFVSRTRLALKDFCEKGVLLKADGGPVSANSIFLMWNKALTDLSVIFWIGVVVVALQTVTEWYFFCFRPLTLHSLGDAGVDWTKLAIVQSDKANWLSELVFSGIAYAYMGFALFIYLIILIYQAAFANFINRIAYHSGRYRLVLRNEVLGDHLAAFATQAYGCTALGLAAAICMRAQAEYIKSNDSIITDLVFGDVRALYHWITQTKEVALAAKPVHIPSEWTSFIELIFTLFLLYLVIYSMYDAFQKSRKNYLDNIESQKWRRSSGIDHDKRRIAEVRQASFLRCILPRHGAMNIVLLGEVLTYLFMGYGLVGVATILFSVFSFILLPALKKRSYAGDPQMGFE